MGYGARGKRAADAEADADAHYGAYGYSALPAYPALYNAYPNWPGYSLPGFSRTLYGARGKRSAEAEAYYGPAYAVAAYPTSHSVVASTQDWPGFAAPGPSMVSGERGQLMLRLRLMPMLTTMDSLDTLDTLDTQDMQDMDMLDTHIDLHMVLDIPTELEDTDTRGRNNNVPISQ